MLMMLCRLCCYLQMQRYFEPKTLNVEELLMLNYTYYFAKIERGTLHNGHNRVLRGGSWINNAQNLRSANRNNNEPDNRNHNYGFRLAGALRTDLIKGRGSLNQRCFLFLCRLFRCKGQSQDPQHVSRCTAQSLLLGRLILKNKILASSVNRP